MNSRIKILYLENDPLDFERISAVLRHHGLLGDLTRVESQSDFLRALDTQAFDLVLSDYQLRGFSSRWALEEVKKRLPGVPFIFVSRAIGEESAIELLKIGASDYVAKEHCTRLISSIQQALRQAADQRARREAEQRLREQAALLDLTQDGFIVTDLSGHVLLWNKGAERLYAWPAAEIMGKEVASLLHSHNPAQFHHCLTQVLNHGEWDGELEKRDRSETRLILQSRWTLMRDSENVPHAILIVDTDITDKKTIEAQLLRAQRLESIGTLAGGIAHDLNNVLAPILMSVQLLREEGLTDATAHLLDTLESSARRGSNIIRQLLTFARGVVSRKTSVSPQQLLVGLQHLIQETFPKSIQLQVNAPDDLWMVSGDPTQLQQVLLNLAVNARDAMPNGGILTLMAENLWLDESMARQSSQPQPGPFVLIQIADTGTGISSDLLDKIFDPFFTTKESDKGTGLGLSTSLGIVKSHNGFILVDSQVNQGSRFRIYLPAMTVGAEPPSPDQQSSHLPSGRGETILLVEDEENVRVVTRQILERHGYQVLTAADGTEAVAVFASNQKDIHLVLTDVMMPFMDGMAVIRALRRMSPKMNFIIATGLSSQTRLNECKELGVAAILAKPFTAETLLETLHQALSAPISES